MAVQRGSKSVPSHADENNQVTVTRHCVESGPLANEDDDGRCMGHTASAGLSGRMWSAVCCVE